MRLTQLEAVGQADVVAAPALDQAGFGRDGEHEPASERPVTGGVGTQPRIIHVAAKPGNVKCQRRTQAAGRANGIVEIAINQRSTDNRAEPLAQGVAKIASGEDRFAAQHAIAIEVAEEAAFVDRHVIIVERVAADQAHIFGQRDARADAKAGRRLLERVLPLAAEEVEAVVIAPIHIDAEREVLVEHVRFGEADLGAARIARPVEAGADGLAAAAEIVLPHRALEHEAFKAGETSRERQFAGGLLLDVSLKHDPVRRAARLLLDFEILLEIAQRIDAVGRAPDLQGVEGIAFRHPELAANDLVLGQRIAVDFNPLDIGPGRFVEHEGHVHGQIFAVAIDLRVGFGKSIAERAGQLGQLFFCIVDLLRIEPVAGLHRHIGGQALAGEVANLALHRDIAEFVALALFHHIGDDEVALVRGEFSYCRDHAEVGIAFGEVILAQLLLVESKAIRIIAGVRAEYLEQAGFLGDHLTLQPAVRKRLVPEDIDLPNLGFGTLRDLEDDIHAVLVQRDHLGFDARGKTPLPLVKLDDAGDVGTHLGPGENLPGSEVDFRADLVVLDPLVTLKHDPVDDRILGDFDHHGARIVTNLHVGE